MTLHMIDDWMKDIRKIARKVEYDWPGVVEADDIVQEVCLHILERPGTQRDLSEMDHNSRYRTIHKIAQRIASQERDAYDVFSGNFRYSVDEVERLVREAGRFWGDEAGSPFSPGSLSASWSVGDIVSTGRGEHSDPTADTALGNLQRESTREDFIAALGKLNPGYLDVIVRRHVHGETGMNSTERSRLERALVELTHEMNHARKRQHEGKFEPGKSLGDGPGSRRAISNSAARFISKDSWDADYFPAPGYLRNNSIEKEVWE